MSAQNHRDLYAQLKKHMPECFGFEKAGILFYEDTSNTLYWMHEHADCDGTAIHLPQNIGLTGQAIREKRTLVFPHGQKQNGLVNLVDNIYDLQGIRNLLMCPIFDEDGKLRGVIQLINKIGLHQQSITDLDVAQTSQICPSLSQILKLFDIVRDLETLDNDLSVNMNKLHHELHPPDDDTFEYDLKMKEAAFMVG